jgi:hypothetical protein
VERVLAEPQVATLAALAATPIAARFYLAGGTALALQLGHRVSEDLDFFSEKTFDPSVEISSLPGAGWVVREAASGTAHLTHAGVRVSLLAYQYPMLRPLGSAPGPVDSRIRLASVEDIIAMKISAIGSRGARRDFVDLYCALNTKGIDLQGALALFDQKFQEARYDRYHFARALAYFADAEREPMLRMLREVSWESVKRFFETQAKELVLAKK